MTRVRCYAGTHSPERPVAFEWEGAWLNVAEVVRQARTPETLVFWVLAENDVCYRLSWQVAADEWIVEKQLQMGR